MKLLYFIFGQPSEESQEALGSWLNGLKDLAIETIRESGVAGSALRAIWRGEPFLIAADPDALDEYLNALDADTAEVLRDCAYFWLLTDSSDYNHKQLVDDRMIVLDWKSPSQNIVHEALSRLGDFPRLKGLSRVTDSVRRRIAQLAKERTGPGCSVLILGPSGSGKEEVCQALVAQSARSKEGVQAISGAWLNMEPGMSMSELVGLERGHKEERIPGLLHLLSKKAMFIDDFESAPKNVQETLLRIMTVPEGEPAPYRPVGAREERFTDVWPIFATNQDVTSFSGTASFARPDFLYRFGARIIWLLPMTERPADLPAIAQSLWKGIWEGKGGDRRKEPLRTAAVKHLFAKELNWDGNVRTLAALLKLLAASMCDPAMNGWSQAEMIDEITDKGPSIFDWVVRYKSRSIGPGNDEHPQQPSAVESTATSIRRAGVLDENDLKTQLIQALVPQGASLVVELEKTLANRVKMNGKPRNDPGRHLFYATLLYLARKNPPRVAGSADLKNQLGVGSGQLQKLCAESKDVFQGSLANLCRCEGGGQTRFRFEMPNQIVR